MTYRVSTLEERRRRVQDRRQRVSGSGGTPRPAIAPKVASDHGSCWDARPLFVPLRREWFDSFRAGTKAEEVRRVSPQFNGRRVWPGRPVILSLGYSGRQRMHGIVGQVRETIACGSPIYPDGTACIAFEVVRSTK